MGRGCICSYGFGMAGVPSNACYASGSCYRLVVRLFLGHGAMMNTALSVGLLLVTLCASRFSSWRQGFDTYAALIVAVIFFHNLTLPRPPSMDVKSSPPLSCCSWPFVALGRGRRGVAAALFALVGLTRFNMMTIPLAAVCFFVLFRYGWKRFWAFAATGVVVGSLLLASLLLFDANPDRSIYTRNYEPARAWAPEGESGPTFCRGLTFTQAMPFLLARVLLGCSYGAIVSTGKSGRKWSDWDWSCVVVAPGCFDFVHVYDDSNRCPFYRFMTPIVPRRYSFFFLVAQVSFR